MQKHAVLQLILFYFVAFFSLTSNGQAQSAPSDAFRHVPREEIPSGEKALNFGAMYLVQWAAYVATQEETIKDHGSYSNWHNYMTKPHFDKDSFHFNLYQHTAVGQYYYLFYRSRGYGKQSAFEWTAISSAAFEFTIETMTERPSYQDLYQTPVFGAIVGMGFESLSLYLHSLQTLPTTLLGYLFNPFTALPYSQYQISLYPTKHEGKNALALTWGTAL